MLGTREQQLRNKRKQMEKFFVASDIQCGGCAASINKALALTAGVQHVAVDLKGKTVTVLFDEEKTSAASITETLTEIGFPPNADGVNQTQ